MSKIRGRDTSPELALRRALHSLGLRFRVHAALPGKPDIVLPRHKAVVFVHGCFWHRHEGCKVASNPKSNTAFWEEKFERNVARDRRVAGQLEAAGWRVLVSWECELTGKGRAMDVAKAIALALGRRPLEDPSAFPGGPRSKP